MANIKSAKKRAKQSIKRAAINHSRLSRVRGAVKSVELAIASGKKDEAAAALKAAQPEMQRGATKGVIAKNTVARKLSRLSARVKALA
jgi:small subunit ribosomal protein S20